MKQSIMGLDSSKESGVWKSRLLEPDLKGLLITEVVIPGFEWQDHQWMSMKDLLFLEDMIRRELEGYVKQ